MHIPSTLSIFNISGFSFDVSSSSLLKSTSSLVTNNAKATLFWGPLSASADIDEGIKASEVCYKTAHAFCLRLCDTRRTVKPEVAKAAINSKLRDASSQRRVSKDERMFIQESVISELSEAAMPSTNFISVFVFPKSGILAIGTKKESEYSAIIKHLKNTFPAVKISPAWSDEAGESSILIDVMTGWVKGGLPHPLGFGHRIQVALGSEKSTFDNFDLMSMDPSFLKGRQVQNLALDFNKLLTFRLASNQVLTHLKGTFELKQRYLEHAGSSIDDISAAGYLAEQLNELLESIDARVQHAKLVAEQKAKSEQPAAWVNPALRT